MGTHQQRFFMSWATIWRSKARDEATKNQVKQIHIPQECTAYVPLQNVDTFYQAFGIQVNDGMYIAPEKKLKSGNENIFIKKSQVSAWDFLFICFLRKHKTIYKSCF
jgi:hypothetical protein